MVVAEFAITPVGAGTSERRYVEAAVEAVRRAGGNPQVGPLGTSLEADSLQQVFDYVRQAHEAALQAGAPRVLLELRVDDRAQARQAPPSQQAQRTPTSR